MDFFVTCLFFDGVRVLCLAGVAIAKKSRTMQWSVCTVGILRSCLYNFKMLAVGSGNRSTETQKFYFRPCFGLMYAAVPRMVPEPVSVWVMVGR